VSIRLYLTGFEFELVFEEWIIGLESSVRFKNSCVCKHLKVFDCISSTIGVCVLG
jgi:hypothetical protein